MDAHVCGRCGHPWSEHTNYSDTNLCRFPGCCCERASGDAEKHNNEDAREALAAKDARIAQLEADNRNLAAEADQFQEAVRVLGEDRDASHREIARLIDCGMSMYVALPLPREGEQRWITHARKMAMACSQQQYPSELPNSSVVLANPVAAKAVDVQT